ncbi:MAG: hypothetical protein ACRC11_19735 [Xenococcaceae cyanobacterium]
MINTALEKETQNSKIECKVVLISPQLARQYLTHNFENNRRPNRSRIKQYADAMPVDCCWLLGEPIKFDSLGRLIDGQKRLMALILSNTTQPFIVISGYPPETALVIDQGEMRNLAQLGHINGVNSISHLRVSLLRAMFLPKYNRPETAKYYKKELLDLYLQFEESVIFASRRLSDLGSTFVIPSPIRAIIAKAHAIGEDPEKLVKFLTVLTSGKAYDSSDLWATDLRNEILRLKAIKLRTKYYINSLALCYSTQHHLYSYLQGESFRQLAIPKVNRYHLSPFDD